jgi:acyl dehydratase
MADAVDGVEGMKAIVGKEIGPSESRPVTQADIDAFAAVSGDHQWIHVDPERAKSESPYGTTIAHGNLTLSLADSFRRQLLRASGFALGVNYGWNKVRFPAPVPTGTRLRGYQQIVEVSDAGGGWHQIVTRFTVEAEGGEKPVCVADSVVRVFADAAG